MKKRYYSKEFKKEADRLSHFASREMAEPAVFRYIEIWYNRKRLHSSLGYKPK